MRVITQQATKGTVSLVMDTAMVEFKLRGQEHAVLPITEIVDGRFNDPAGFRKNDAGLFTMTGSSWKWQTWEPTAPFIHLVLLLGKWGRTAQESAVAQDIIGEEVSEIKAYLERLWRGEE